MSCLPSKLDRSGVEGKVSREAAENKPAEGGGEGWTATPSVERHKVCRYIHSNYSTVNATPLLHTESTHSSLICGLHVCIIMYGDHMGNRNN